MFMTRFWATPSDAGLLPSALWLECLAIGWKDSSARALLAPTGSMRTDIVFLLLDQAHVMGALGRVMMLGASVISGVGLRDWLLIHTGFAIDPSAFPLALQVIVYFVAYCFFDYWAHRLAHTRLFWPLHRYHHAAQDFCVVNGARSHPAGFLGIFLINLPMPLLGATPEAMIWVNVIVDRAGLFDPFAHRIRLGLDRPLAGPVAAGSSFASQAGHEPADRFLRHDARLGSSVRRME